MSCQNFIYRFLNQKDEIIYIGKAKNIMRRLGGHCHLQAQCYDETTRFEILGFMTEADRDLAEVYYIQKYKPFYNTHHYDKELTFPIPFLDSLSWSDFEEADILEIKQYNQREKLRYFRLNDYYLTAQEILDQIQRNPSAILKLKKTTEEMLNLAFTQDGSLIESFLNEFSPAVFQKWCRLAFKSYPKAIKYLKTQTPEDGLIAVQSDAGLIHFVKHKTEETYQIAIEQEPSIIYTLKGLPDTSIHFALHQDGLLIKELKKITYEQALTSVRQNGLALKWVPKKFHREAELIEAAIFQNTLAIKETDHCTESIIYHLIEVDPELLMYTCFTEFGESVILDVLSVQGKLLKRVKSDQQTQEMCKRATEQDASAIRYAKFKTLDMCWSAIKQDPTLFRYLPQEFRLPEMYDWVVESNPHWIRYIPKNQITKPLYLKALTSDYTVFYSSPHLLNRDTDVLSLVYEKETDLDKFFSRLDSSDTQFLTHDIAKEGLNQNGLWLTKFKNPTPDLCDTALSQTILALPFIEVLSLENIQFSYQTIMTLTQLDPTELAFLKRNLHDYQAKEAILNFIKQLDLIKETCKKDQSFNLKKWNAQTKHLTEQLEAGIDRHYYKKFQNMI